MSCSVNEQNGAVTFSLHVKPRSSRDEIVGIHGDALALRITAPPVDGAANEAIRRFFAKTLKVPASSVEIVAGQSGKSKIIKIVGATREQIETLISSRPGLY